MNKKKTGCILKKALVLMLSLCLVIPAALTVKSAYASTISDRAKEDKYVYEELGGIIIWKIGYEYDRFKTPAEFAKFISTDVYGDSNFATAKDIHDALNYYYKNGNLGSAKDKKAFGNLLLENGCSQKFVKDLWTNYKEKAATNVKDMSISVADAKYSGKAVTPKVTVETGGKTLKKGKDYTVSYKNNKKEGTGTAVIKGKGKYKGKVKVSFTIKPQYLDESLPTFWFTQTDIIGDDVCLIWNNNTTLKDGLKVQVLRADKGSSNYKVIATLEKTNLGFVQHSYIDKGIGNKGYQYQVRALDGKNYGKSSSAVTPLPTQYKWYKADNGEYICMREWKYGQADFTGFDVNFDVVWNCDWSYSSIGGNSYSIGMYWDPGDGGDVYNERMDVTITDEYFRFEDNGFTYYSLNDIPISIE